MLLIFPKITHSERIVSKSNPSKSSKGSLQDNCPLVTSEPMWNASNFLKNNFKISHCKENVSKSNPSKSSKRSLQDNFPLITSEPMWNSLN